MAIQDEKLDYQIAIEDIRFTKKQLWNTVYYSLIANSGIIALVFGLNSNLIAFTIKLRWVFTAISIFVTAIGILLLYRYHWSLTEYRLKKEEIKNGNADYDDIKCKKIWKRYFCQLDFWLFTFVFSFVIVISLTLTLIVIWNIDC